MPEYSKLMPIGAAPAGSVIVVALAAAPAVEGITESLVTESVEVFAVKTEVRAASKAIGFAMLPGTGPTSLPTWFARALLLLIVSPLTSIAVMTPRLGVPDGPIHVMPLGHWFSTTSVSLPEGLPPGTGSGLAT